MKYAFMTFSTPEADLDENIKVAKKYGYDGIEPRVDCQHKHGIEFNSTAEFRKECKKKSEESGIKLCCIATSCMFSDPQKREKMVEDANKAIDLAGDVGAPCIRVFGGLIPKDVTREAAMELVVKSMKEIAGHAKQRNVTVCVETHDDWCNPKHLAEVLKKVNHPSIAINWDIMHPVRTKNATMDEAFEAIKPYIRHVHFHDGINNKEGKNVLVEIGKGEIDHKRAVELLKTINYGGYLSGEWIKWEPADIHLPREIGTMKKYESM